MRPSASNGFSSRYNSSLERPFGVGLAPSYVLRRHRIRHKRGGVRRAWRIRTMTTSTPRRPNSGRSAAKWSTSTGLSSVMAHAYRGELGRVDTWRQRLDQTTTWAVTVMAAILTWAFSSSDNPHYILLIGIVVVTVFLGIEARRYWDYDVFRARVRMLPGESARNCPGPVTGRRTHRLASRTGSGLPRARGESIDAGGPRESPAARVSRAARHPPSSRGSSE